MPKEFRPKFEAFSEEQIYSPERSLVAAILLRAIRDVSKSRFWGRQLSGNNLDITEGHKMAARCWFLTDETSEEFFTFIDCCYWLQIDARELRRKLFLMGWLDVPPHLR
jgi:hypothetical protein